MDALKEIVYRRNWLALPFKGETKSIGKISDLVLHHTAMSKDMDGTNSIRCIKEVQNYHIFNRGWDDIGYHFLLDSVGTIFQGRQFHKERKDTIFDEPIFAEGAHVSGYNSTTLGISILGTFHLGKDEISKECYDSLISLLKFLCVTYNIPFSNIKGHQDFDPFKKCPGDNIYNLIPKIISDLG